MPNLKASIKDLRKTKKRTDRRKSVVSGVRNILKKIRTKNPEEAGKMLPMFIPLLIRLFRPVS